MARRALQLAATLALATGVLGVSAALIDQAREEVLTADPPEPSVDLGDPQDDTRGLPLTAFTLLDPAAAHLPNRTHQGSTLQLTGNGTLSLQEGDRIDPAPVPVPADARAAFPAGATATEGGYECGDGCTVRAAGTAWTVPAGGRLDTPRAPPRDPSPGDEVELPSPTSVHVELIQVDGPTPLPVLEGALVRLPGDAAVPPVDADTVELPADTRIQGPPGSGPGTPRLDRVDEGPRVPASSPDLEPPPSANVTLLEAPQVLRKGEIFTVRGLVEDPEGVPLAEHPVTVFANASLDRPGREVQLGTVVTDGTGTFEATARLPLEAPVHDYHLVARADADPQADPPVGAGFDDAATVTEADPRLSLDAPQREGARVPVSLSVTLQDEHGAPVPDRPVTVRAPGTAWTGEARTGPDGNATLVHPTGFPHPGNWSLEATFAATEHLSGSTDEASVEALDARLETPATITLPRGETTPLEGRLDRPGNTSNVTVHAALGTASARTTTDDNGHFTLPIRTPSSTPLGTRSLVLETEGVTARRTVAGTVTGQTTLTTHPPDALPRGGALDLRVAAATDRGDPAAGLPVRAVVDGTPVGTAVTDDEGDARLPVPLDDANVQVTLETPGTTHLEPARETVDLAPQPVAVDGELAAGLGHEREATVRLTAGGAPLADTPVRLHGADVAASGRTDADGQVTLGLQAPEDAAPGARRAQLALAAWDLAQPVTVTVLDQPDLAVRVLEEGDPLRLEATVLGAGGPLAEVPVTATATGAFEAEATAFTEPDGTVELELDPPRGAEGPAEVTLETPRTGDTAPASTTAEATVSADGLPWWPLAVALPALAVAGAWLLRGREAPGEPPADPRLSLRLRRQREGWPPVWHPGDPLDVAVTVRDEQGTPLPGQPVRLEGPEAARRLETDEDGVARTRLPPHEVGRHRYTARLDDGGQATLEVRVVDYGEEIDRAYHRLRRDLVDHGLVAPDATPHELARALGTPAARRLARRFERFNYSPHSPSREDYERFLEAKEACRPGGP